MKKALNFLVRNRPMIYLLSFLFITYTSIPATTQIDPVFEPYMRITPFGFNELVKESHLVIKLGVIRDKEVVGFCAKEYNVLGDLSRRLIIIDKNYWNGFSYKKRQLLLWHEIGHCMFNKKHDDNLFLDGCPRSIMHPSVIPEKCIDIYYDSYILQLL